VTSNYRLERPRTIKCLEYGRVPRPLNLDVRRFVLMRVLVVVASVVGGLAIASLLVAIPCTIPGLRNSNGCGHNAYVWFPLAIPVGIWIAWPIASRCLRLIKSWLAARARS
jgi:hypothetical protein